MRRVWRHYGAGPLHLLSLVACFALTGYVVTRVWTAPHHLQILVWFGGAVIIHDLLLFPLYAVADRSLAAAAAARRHPDRLPEVPWINHVRVPAVVSAVLLAVSFPLVFRLSERTYHAATGLSTAPYLNRWLFVTGVLFAGSAVLYAVRLGRAAGRRRQGAADVAPGA
jgi:hypothetical protein